MTNTSKPPAGLKVRALSSAMATAPSEPAGGAEADSQAAELSKARAARRALPRLDEVGKARII